ncbi:hypothetical protein Emag_007345 [Eimeria magna]
MNKRNACFLTDSKGEASSVRESYADALESCRYTSLQQKPQAPHIVVPFSTAPRSRGGFPGFAGCRRYKSLQEEEVFTGAPPFAYQPPPHSRMFIQSAQHGAPPPAEGAPGSLGSAPDRPTDACIERRGDDRKNT